MILLICPIRIDACDELPKAICSICLKLVLDAITLREKSVKSDLKFRHESLAIETPEMLRIKQEAIFEDENEDEEANQKQRKRKRTKSPPEIYDDYSSNDEWEEEVDVKQKANDKRHKCPLCPVTFSFTTNLTRHMKKTHNSDRPRKPPKIDFAAQNSCSICGMAFTTRSNKKRHEKRMHGMHKDFDGSLDGSEKNETKCVLIVDNFKSIEANDSINGTNDA